MIFRYNEYANIASLDPAFARDQAIIWATNQLFNGLVQLDSIARVQSCIARSWTICDSGKTYIFHLRNDVYFHDNKVFKNEKGRKVCADDFVFSLTRLIDPALASPGSWVLNSLDFSSGKTPVTAVNDSTLVIRLAVPFPPFLALLSMQYCSVVPREAIEYYGRDFRKNPVGTGPFRFAMWEEGVKLVLLKNHRYFEFSGTQRLPFLDAVAISFIPDRQTVFLGFLRGKFDMLSGIDASYKDELLTRNGLLQAHYTGKIKLISQPYLNTEYLGFMMDPQKNRQPWLLDRRIRQAINFSFDREKMITFLRNNVGTPGYQGIVPQGLPSFDSGNFFYNYDQEKAKKLLATAGYPNGKGLPPIKLVSTPDYLDICKYIQYKVSEIGIKLEIEVSTPAAVKEMKAEGKLDFFRASWIADYPESENYLSLFLTRNFCPQGPNYTHFSDSVYDSLFNAAMFTINDSVRNTIYRCMESRLMDASPVVILYYDRVLRFTGNDVRGLGSNPMNLLVLKYVTK
jgi:peptide/nickel transport system substrate-binding protein